MISAASLSLVDAWNSPCALITFARRARSASAVGGHRPLHRVGQVHVLDFHDRDLDPPRLGVPVDDLLQLQV